MSPATPTAAQAAAKLTEALNTMSDRLEQVRQASEERDEVLTRYGRSNRWRIRLLIISLAIDIALTVALSVVAVQAHHASARAQSAAASNMALCQAGNVARHQQIELWSFVISLGNGKRDKAQQHNVALFTAQLHKIFAPRDCATLGHRR